MKTLLLLLFCIHPTLAVFSMDPDPDILPCLPNKTFNLVDASHLKLLFDPKVQRVYLDGYVKLIKDFSGKMEFNFTTRVKKHRSIKWENSMFKFYTSDVCNFINDPLGQPIVYMA